MLGLPPENTRFRTTAKLPDSEETMKRIASLLGLILCSILAFAVKPARIALSISPATATLYSGATKQFTATVSGTTNAAVTWSTTAGQLRSTGAEILLAHAAMQPATL
jgi:4-hydroxybenzoate polyprenyltransferase